MMYPDKAVGFFNYFREHLQQMIRDKEITIQDYAKLRLLLIYGEDGNITPSSYTGTSNGKIEAAMRKEWESYKDTI